MRFTEDRHLAHFLSPELFFLTVTTIEPGQSCVQMTRAKEETRAVTLRA